MGDVEISVSAGVESKMRYHSLYIAFLTPRLGNSVSLVVYLGLVPPKK